MTDVLPLLLDITELAALSLLVSLLYDTVQELARTFTRLTRPTANAAMTVILALLVEINALTDRSDASDKAWLPPIRLGVCKLTRMMLAKDCPMHSPAVHDARREDSVALCLAMARLAATAEKTQKLTRTEHTLRLKLHALASKCIAVALQANANAAISSARPNCADAQPSAFI